MFRIFRTTAKFCAVFLVILSLSAFAAPSRVRAQDEFVPNPAAEQYVLERVNASRPADLANAFDNEADRVISADFLSGLLRQTTPGLRVQSWGLDLRNAIVVGDMLEYNVAVPFEVYFDAVHFTDEVFLNQFNFQKQVSFRDCTFDGNFDLSYSNFDYSLVITNSVFNAPVNLVLLNVARSIYASGIVVNDALTLVGSNVERELDFSDSQFTSTETTADFDGITVGWKAFFRRAVFAGNANFYAAKFKFLIAAQDAQFTNPNGWADFSNAEIANVAFLDNTVFAGSVYFTNTKAWIVQMSNASFTSETAEVHFSLQAEEVYMKNSEFAGVVNMTDMEVSETLDLSESKFLNVDNEVICSSWHVGAADLSNTNFSSSVDFSGSIFTEGVELGGARVAGQLIMSGVSIADSLNLDNVALNYTAPAELAVDEADAQAARFDYLSVNSALSMKNTAILGSIDMRYLNAGHLFLEPDASASTAIPRLDLRQANISGEFSIKNLTVDELDADSLTVAGPLNVDGLTIGKSAQLRNSNFSYVGLQSVDWPKTKDSLTLDSMNYSFISVTQKESINTKEVWRDSLDFINNANFSLDVYKKLESFFMEQGEIEAANAVFVAMRDRQAEQYTWLEPQRWWYLFLKMFILYGRGPQIAALWSALFIFAGALVFRKKEGMDPAEMDDPAQHFYHPIWYSFDAFIPYIDLNMNTAWQPKAERRLANTYLRFHNIMGWVLIPIALLAIGGVI